MRPQPPRWLLEAGLPEPQPGDDLVGYWRRHGVPQHVIDGCYEGLTERTLELANVRVNTQVRLGCPAAFTEYVDGLCARHGVRRLLPDPD